MQREVAAGVRLELHVLAEQVGEVQRVVDSFEARHPVPCVLTRALAALPVDSALVDGEVVALAADGTTSFGDLQDKIASDDTAVLVFFAFDLLYRDGHDLTAESRSTEPCLQQFANLVHSHAAEVSEYVPKAKWLEPEDLFYLGFHFAEKEREEKKFGGDVLHLLVKRSPQSKLAKDAKNKLKREGFD